jgi:hypothetical protein
MLTQAFADSTGYAVCMTLISYRSRDTNVSALSCRMGLSKEEVRRVARLHLVEQLETFVYLTERVERAVTSGLLCEDANQASGCEESDIPSGERSPGLLDAHLEGGEETAHARLNVDPAIDWKNPHDGVDGKGRKVPVEGNLGLTAPHERNDTIDLGDRASERFSGQSSDPVSAALKRFSCAHRQRLI